MKFTLSWLKEYLDTNASVQEISEKLTSVGLEVESVNDFAKTLQPFTVAEILETEKHPQADKLKLCKVNAGNGEILSIVCGAANARAGIKVPLAKIGSIIPNGNFEIKKSKIRGVDSNGMLCSAEELNLAESSEGILELPENSVVGEPFAKFIGRDDCLFEIAITPNRGDCLGVYGIARDLATAGLGKLKTLQYPEIAGSFESPIKVNISGYAAKYFIGVYIKNVDNSRTCDWLKNRLESIGKKSISPAVDITNYLTFAFGRPAHVYDADRLQGNLQARRAISGEKIKALDGNEYKLKDAVSVIADEVKPVAISGIMGGEETGVTAQTKNIFLEIANFDTEIVVKAGRELQIDSDARYRFERGIDFLSYNHYKTAVKLITDICGGEVSKPVTAGILEYQNTEIDFDYSLTEKITGIKIDKNKSQEILQKLGFKIGSKVTVPSWRNDVSIAEDLVEEITRIYGLDNIPVKYLAKPLNNSELQTENKNETIRKILTAKGLEEVVTFSFANSKFAKQFEKTGNLIEIANPISSDLDVMRPTILVNLIEAAAKNIARSRNNLKFFEIGNIFEKNKKDFQSLCVSGIATGNRTEKSPNSDEEKLDIFDIKSEAEAVLALYIDPVKLKIQRSSLEYYHPGKSGEYMLGNVVVANFGEIHPEITKSFDIKQKIYGFEVFLDNLPLPKQKQGFVRKLFADNPFQPIERDFAFVLDKNIMVSELVNSIKKSQKDYLEEVRIFDVYEGDKIDSGKKSVAIKLVLQPKEATFTDEQIEKISSNVISAASAIGAVLRA